jgi:hypothetical protein
LSWDVKQGADYAAMQLSGKTLMLWTGSEAGNAPAVVGVECQV